MSVRGCGVDLVEIDRIAKALQRQKFRDRIYTEYERNTLHSKGVQSWAARFAAKEAVMKAIGLGWQQGVPFGAVEIYTNAKGQPQVRLLEPAQKAAADRGITRFVLSLSHTRELAMAYVIALGEE
ncbi:MAG: holo-ACP synthase [Firmicutes bacterium]|nr:holo-ACP synthase [Bacillota bacterium]